MLADPHRDRDHAVRRLTETRLLHTLDESDDPGRLARLVDGTDWLQRRAAAHCRSGEVLSLLAEEGRTRRVRNLARRRVSDLG